MADVFALTLVSLALAAGVSLLFRHNRKHLLVLCTSAFAAGAFILPTISIFNRYAIIVAFGPFAEEVCRFVAIHILRHTKDLKLDRWVVGLGFWSLEGFSKSLRFAGEIIGGREISVIFALRIATISGSAFLHILIASIVLSNWGRSPVLAFLLGLGLHVGHNGAAAIFAANATEQSAPWFIAWPAFYAILCVTCFGRYDEQVRAARHNAPAA